MSKSADRAAEFVRLIEEQGRFTQATRDRGQTTAEEMGESSRRYERLLELVELMGVNSQGIPDEQYVNERVQGWMKSNPVALTNHALIRRVEETTRTYSEAPNTCTVGVQIGEGDKAYFYPLVADDLVAVRGGGQVRFKVPEAVAEHFRQQGRRKQMREAANALGFKLDW